ncbi:unnamed protein product [Pleuronectes platessa]|uniref:Uncharacterized protein n=1 Tax=Pleuronectes platessa TaxID=8262 RepID=A0A9N7YVI3_PLEPL|nr:unnamed protein product [Pleuronectes platessa]
MDNKSKKRPGGAEKHRKKKLKSLEVEAATCAKLTDLFGAGFTSPAAAGAPGDERGGLDHDERVEADMSRRRRRPPYPVPSNGPPSAPAGDTTPRSKRKKAPAPLKP